MAGRIVERQAAVEWDRHIVVWDLGVRLFHWLLVAAVAGAAGTGLFGSKATLDIHLACGTIVAVLVVWRLIWGGLGSTYARFRSFVVGPAALARHGADLLHGRAPAHVGHNPLGGVSVVVMLATLAALVATGVVALGGAVKDGPLAPFVGFAAGVTLRRVHEIVAWALLGLIGLHVVGVLLESWRTREGLVGAMLSGRKRRRPDAVATPPIPARPVPALLAFGVASAASTGGIVHLAGLPALGVPTAPLDATYARECGACHTPHHPSLAGADTWARLMAGLDDHFGDNASLAAPLAAEVAAYLAANAAEQWDSPAAHLSGEADSAEPLRITATAGWRRTHRGVAEATFRAKAVGGRLNCANCHLDASTGRFLPRAISVPAAAINPGTDS